MVYIEGKKHPFCPKCRGRMFTKEKKLPKKAKKITCPSCEKSFYMTSQPFKCPFCDHNFALGEYW
jgi:predicted Zn finger-like uncharacterized protein